MVLPSNASHRHQHLLILLRTNNCYTQFSHLKYKQKAHDDGNNKQIHKTLVEIEYNT